VLAHSIPFSPEHDQEVFGQLPSGSGIFLLRGDGSGAEPYLSKSANLRRRISRLLGPPEADSKRLNLREHVSEIQYTPTASDFENLLLLYRSQREYFPKTYAKRMKLTPAALIRLNWDNEFPRAYVTRKLSKRGGKSVYYGPFRSRADAEKYLTQALDLFRSRRCHPDLNPDPSFPGCVYSEMKMCLAPCYLGCTDDEYAAEVKRVEQFLDTCGQSLISQLSAEREQASAALEFERAAALHARMEKVQGIARTCDEVIRRIDRLDAIIMQRSLEADCVRLFRCYRGELLGPIELHAGQMLISNEKSGDSSLYAQPFIAEPVPEKPARTPKSPSLEVHMRETVAQLVPADPGSRTQVTEQLALFKRWYYRKSRGGEVFIADRNGELPWRRMVRGVSRVLAGAIATAETIES
jgi:excinuclease ABC subunit C